MIPPLTIHDVFEGLAAHCTHLKGAAVATPDGLVLASTGAFDGDAPAACAAGLATSVDNHLSFLAPSRCNDGLVWADSGVWYLARLPNDHLLLVWSGPEEQVGLLRLAVQRAAQQLAPMLSTTR